MEELVDGVVVTAVVTIVTDILSDDEDDDDVETSIFDIYWLSTGFREDRIKSLEYFEYTIPRYLPDLFKQFFKVSHETLEVLCESLSQYPCVLPEAYPRGREHIPLQKKVLMTVRYLVSQETVKELSDRFGVTGHSFLRCKRQIIQTMCDHLLCKFITWPKHDEFRDISTRFDEMGRYNFPDILGTVDGSHIPIQAPIQNPKSYFNRKQFHSIVLQGVCIDDLRFIDVNVGWPGRVHDAKVLRNSSLWEEGFQNCDNGNYHLVGDGAYPFLEWLLTPYRDNGHLSQQQTQFNMALSSKRQVIERAFGLLKGRFRRLKFINMKSIREVCQTVVSACILHNVCIIEHDLLEDLINENEHDVILEENDGNAFFENDARGLQKRINITNRM